MTCDWRVSRLLAGDTERVGAVLGLARLHQGDGVYFVAWDDGEPVGHAYLALNDPPELQDVEVRRAYRRRGVARALAGAVELAAQRCGYDRLRVTVSQEAEAAQALYRSLGYTDTGLPPRRVVGMVQIRTGAIEVDDTLLSWEKRLP